MPLGKELLKIGQVAKLSGLSSRTIDYYTQCGLLSFERSPSNYRLYDESVLHTLERIRLLKKQRMSLDEISASLQLPYDENHEPLLNEVREEINKLQKKMVSLEETMKHKPKEEKARIYQDLSNKLAVITQLLTLL
ncbi:MerR family transcriptional regulator [Jeotgalibacillus proteolyticus]|uniref:MerR family transcriptional regulator n=1 Tax=Jeotgalibacillus proteolyticus TaxID=2082395 RepID=A0A2S5G6R1_9BACL|nr:MerR family transcriptional regulator [Jeotgalibacillus proteolyticus]PPA68667.1 MerR family transcriptional regulator [Jeotgalibacillus proteolyticus]PPA68744.1 MerR family transcriptional regulator [Jeotgalibacillus proteolyticus]